MDLRRGEESPPITPTYDFTGGKTTILGHRNSYKTGKKI